MAPVKKNASKGFWSFCSCFQPDIVKVIEPATRSIALPPPPPAVVTPPFSPEPAPVPRLLRAPLPPVEEADVHSDGDIIDVDIDMGAIVIRAPEENKSVTLSSVMLVLTAIALATLLLNVD